MFIEFIRKKVYNFIKTKTMNKLLLLIGRIIALPLLTILKYEGRYRVRYYKKVHNTFRDWNGKVQYYSTREQQRQLPYSFTRRINGRLSLFTKVDEATGRNQHFVFDTFKRHGIRK
jgi:hypothetical protein